MKNTIALLLTVFILAACKPPKEKEAVDWKLGVALWSFHSAPFAGQLAAADSTGTKNIEVFAFGKAGPEFNDSVIFSLSASGADKLKAMIDKSGLTVRSLYMVGGTDLGMWVREFEVARRLKVEYVVVEPPVAMLDKIDSLAGAFGIKAAIHNHWKGNSPYWHPDSVLAALQGHPNLAACPDPGHWPKSGLDPLECIKKLEGHIIAMHLKDIAAPNDPKLVDVPVGTGIVDFPAIFKELKRQKFSGYINIERDADTKPSNVESVKKTIEYYNKQVSEL